MTTVVIPTFNSAGSVAVTLRSILSQSRQPERILVIDGGSRDETLEVVRKFLRPQDLVVSERDSGPYDAMNKGINLAQSEVISILNSDDTWLPGTLELIENTFRIHPEVGVVHGDIDYTVKDSKSMRIKPTRGFWRNLGLGLPTVHPAAFIRKSIYNKVGLYNFKRFPMTADQDLLYRAFRANVRDYYIPKVLTVMSGDGLSSYTDLGHEIDDLLAEVEPSWRRPALTLRKYFFRENKYYNGLISSGYGPALWKHQLAPRNWTRHLASSFIWFRSLITR